MLIKNQTCLLPASLLVLCVLSACGAAPDADPDSPDQQVSSTSQAIQGGTNVVGQKGVIELTIFHEAENKYESCTGVLIGPHHALTAAHCTNLGGSGLSSALVLANISYFSPSGTLKTLSAREQWLGEAVIPTWDGISNKDAWDHQDDLAIIFSPKLWPGTDSRDYQDIYVGSFADIRSDILFGAGANASDGTGGGTLRSMPISIAHYDTYSFYDLGGTRRICWGDSGGPYITSVNTVSAVLGIHSSSEKGNNGACTENGGKQFGVRLNSRLSWISGWINTNIGGSCTVNGQLAHCAG